MNSQNTGVVIVKQDHIQRGIEKYNGIIDERIKQLFLYSGIDCDPYAFVDGRILVVYKNISNALLYPSEESLFSSVVFENIE